MCRVVIIIRFLKAVAKYQWGYIVVFDHCYNLMQQNHDMGLIFFLMCLFSNFFIYPFSLVFLVKNVFGLHELIDSSCLVVYL